MTQAHAFILLGTLFGLMIVAAIITHRRVRLQIRILRFLVEYGGAVDVGPVAQTLGTSVKRCQAHLDAFAETGHTRYVFDERGDQYWLITPRGYKALKYHERN